MKLRNSLKKLCNYKLFLIYLVIYFIYLHLSSTFQGYWSDMECWKSWASYELEYGLNHAYKSGTDYLPLYHYVLYLFAKIQGNVEAIAAHIYLLRYFTLFIEFIAGFFLLKLIYDWNKNMCQSILYSLIYFLNIFMFYNSLIWGQIDGILAGLLFISFYFAFKQKISWSVTFYILALNLKLQAIIFLPVIGLILLPTMIGRFSWKNLFSWLWFPVYLQFFILIPFIIAGDMDRLWMVVTKSASRYPVVSMNAFNVWDLFLRGDLLHTSDMQTFGDISYYHWGLIMFFISSFFALFYLLKINYQQFKNIKEVLSLEKTLLIAGLIPLLFFYFNTQMHERYVHPALIFLACYSIFSKDYLPYILLSIAYFINMETVLNQFNLFGFESIRVICSMLYLIVIMSIFTELYRKNGERRYKKKEYETQ